MTPSARPWRRRCADDSGRTTLEVVVLAPLLILLLLFTVYCGRIVSAKLDVSSAARSAARAASLARTTDGARQQATDAATGTLGAHSRICGDPQITIDTTDMRPGGSVTATITCTVPVGDLFLSAVRTKRLTASSTSPIDVFRGRP
jgi:Flp pilus assembly protein TadG